MISIIVAVAKNNAIGKNNKLLWHISNDLKRFKRITTGHTVIMGRNTWLSLPVKPLPNRKNIVISDNPEDCFESCWRVDSIDAALAQCDPDDESFVIGGASIYEQFLPLADKLYITRVHKDFEGDTFFPEIDKNIWELSESEGPFEMPDKGFEYTFESYRRKS